MTLSALPISLLSTYIPSPFAMEKVLEIASEVSTPIGVAGLLVAVILIIFYGILKLKIFPELNQIMAKHVISSMMKYLFILALVAIVLGFFGYLTPIVLGALFPPRQVPPDSRTMPIRSDYPLKNAIDRAAKSSGHSVVRVIKCDETVMSANVKAGTYTGRNFTDIIDQFQYNLTTPVPGVQPGAKIYQVVLHEGGYYEITCQN